MAGFPVEDKMKTTQNEFQQRYQDLRNDELAANLAEPISKRSGCKVAWATYANREDAEKRAVFAKREAQISYDLGYDFGYLEPGTITELANGTFEVVLP